ncbi:MAG: hypothetical protein HJJLKODD_02226 [Phycisphaerae bacterium]|nr:hypothetical protein [Phycisphaerae bacterium]
MGVKPISRGLLFVILLAFLQEIDNFLMFRESANLMLAEDQLTINLHIKYPAGTLDHFRFYAELFTNGVRQTGGFGSVVSLHAVGNRNLHILNLFLVDSLMRTTNIRKIMLFIRNNTCRANIRQEI